MLASSADTANEKQRNNEKMKATHLCIIFLSKVLISFHYREIKRNTLTFLSVLFYSSTLEF